MKRFLLIGLAMIGFIIPAKSAVFSTNITSTLGGTFCLLTTRASVYNVEITGAYPVVIDFYDCDSLAAPFYGTNSTNAAWVSRTSYATNFVTSMVGYNGYTNWYTNAGLWTVNSTNAASTNELPKMLSFAVSGNSYAVYNTDALFSRGICVKVTTNVTVVINYKSGQ